MEVKIGMAMGCDGCVFFDFLPGLQTFRARECCMGHVQTEIVGSEARQGHLQGKMICILAWRSYSHGYSSIDRKRIMTYNHNKRTLIISTPQPIQFLTVYINDQIPNTLRTRKGANLQLHHFISHRLIPKQKRAPHHKPAAKCANKPANPPVQNVRPGIPQ